MIVYDMIHFKVSTYIMSSSSSSSKKKRAAIIGAGACGITTAKCCLDEGIDIVVYERSKYTGGLWRFTEGQEGESSNDGTPTVMRSTVINSYKEISAFSDFPPPENSPNFMHNSQWMEYIDQYAESFNFNSYIQLQTEIIHVTPSVDHDRSGRWQVHWRNLQSGLEQREVFDAVYICTGHHGHKSIPEKLPGQEKFKGKILHTNDVKSGDGFRGQKVVVVGMGNSGADLAAELGTVAKQVYVSLRHGTWVAQRVGPFGLPFDHCYIRRITEVIFSLLPYWFFCSIVEFFFNFGRLDHDLYRLKPTHRILSQHLTINDALANLIVSARVQLWPKLAGFTEKGVIFEGGEEVEVDAVVFATGYRIKFPFLSDDLIQVEKNRIPLYKYVFPPHLPHAHTLAFIGLVQPLGPIVPMAELQARWAARLLVDETDSYQLPDKEEMLRDIEHKRKNCRFYASERHTVSMDWLPSMDEYAQELKCKPNLLQLFLNDPKLWVKLIFGSATPYQYRLTGPHSWPKARETIMDLNRRVQLPYQTRPNDVTESCSTNPKLRFFWILWFVSIVGLCLVVTKVLGNKKMGIYQMFGNALTQWIPFSRRVFNLNNNTV